MKIELKNALMIVAAAAPLFLTNCIVLVDGGGSIKERRLERIEESRLSGKITESKYNILKDEIMKSDD